MQGDTIEYITEDLLHFGIFELNLLLIVKYFTHHNVIAGWWGIPLLYTGR